MLKGGPADWNTPIWEHDLEAGLRILRLAIDTHMITSHFLLPLLIERPGGLLVEVTDGTSDYNAARYRISAYYDLAKVAVNRLAFSQGHELGPHGAVAVAVTPGWLRSEMMLEAFGVTEDNWRTPSTARRAATSGRAAGLRPLRDAPLRRPCCRRPGRGRRPWALEPVLGDRRRTGPRLRLHRPRRHPAGRLAALGLTARSSTPRDRRPRPASRRIVTGIFVDVCAR